MQQTAADSQFDRPTGSQTSMPPFTPDTKKLGHRLCSIRSFAFAMILIASTCAQLGCDSDTSSQGDSGSTCPWRARLDDPTPSTCAGCTNYGYLCLDIRNSTNLEVSCQFPCVTDADCRFCGVNGNLWQQHCVTGMSSTHWVPQQLSAPKVCD